MNEIKDDELFNHYFGEHSSYYSNVLKKVNSGSKFIFGVFPFLFVMLWMLYRKMYLICFITIVITGLLFDFIEKNWMSYYPETNIKAFSIIQNFSLAIVFGFLGNWLYVKDAERKIKKLKQKYGDSPILIEKIKKNGGVNWIAPLLFLAFIIAVLWAVSQQKV